MQPPSSGRELGKYDVRGRRSFWHFFYLSMKLHEITSQNTAIFKLTLLLPKLSTYYISRDAPLPLTVISFFLTYLPLCHLCKTFTSFVAFPLEKTRHVFSTHRHFAAYSKNEVLNLRAEIKEISTLKFSPNSNKHK